MHCYYGDRKHATMIYQVVIMSLFWRLYEHRTNVDSRTILVPTPPDVSKMVVRRQQGFHTN